MGSQEKTKHRKKRKARRENTQEKWNIFYANAQGLQGKITCLVDILTENTPQLALFTETMLNDKTNINVDGYKFCGKSRSTKGCGGVGILVRNDIQNYVTPHETTRALELPKPLPGGAST